MIYNNKRKIGFVHTLFGYLKILGIIENMSGFVCPKCGEVSYVFGHGGAKQTARQLGVDFLGEVQHQHKTNTHSH